MQSPVHHHYSRNSVIVSIPARLAKPRHVANIDPCNILDLHWHVIELAERDILDVFDVAAVGQIGSAAGIDETDAPDVHRLLADVDGSRADIDIGIANSTHELR